MLEYIIGIISLYRSKVDDQEARGAATKMDEEPQAIQSINTIGSVNMAHHSFPPFSEMQLNQIPNISRPVFHHRPPLLMNPRPFMPLRPPRASFRPVHATYPMNNSAGYNYRATGYGEQHYYAPRPYAHNS